MADEVAYDNILESHREEIPFYSKEILTIQDGQNGSYNTQITFDTSQLATNGLYINWSKSTLEIPYLISVKSTVDLTGAPPSSFASGLKNGFYQLVDSISVSYGNTTVVYLS